jgi:hypothetical protein
VPPGELVAVAQANLDGMYWVRIDCPAILPSRGCPADGVTAPTRRHADAAVVSPNIVTAVSSQ